MMFQVMKTSDFDYFLPQQLIAQCPVEPRDRSRLMVLNKGDGSIEHSIFCDITSYLRAGDVLVFNNSRVIPARLMGRKVDTGGRVEILLLRRCDKGWEVLVKPGRRVKIGTRIEVTKQDDKQHNSGVLAEVTGIKPGGIRLVSFADEGLLPRLGKVPLPPYIHTPLAEPERYQTVYADEAGSVAAPTAGLHFTPELLSKIQNKGVDCLFVALHIGLDTFRPVKEEDPSKHSVYREYGVLDEEAAGKLSLAKEEGCRIICVGTTTVRLIEYVAQFGKKSGPFEGWVDLFILPGYRFRMVDAMVTNFHLPRSTTLMLVTAFAGENLIKKAYVEAIANGYRFYSFGDAMLIL
jgi:S-adenosylmethionine:tRNA ribosyltransferase-isomerase